MGREVLRSAELLGVNISVGTRAELLERAASMIGVGGAISTVNPEILYDSLRNDELHRALLESVCIPDGIGVVNALKNQGIKCERFPGVELGEALLEVREVKLGIIGGKEGIAECALEELTQKHRNVIPEFAVSGYNINYEAFRELLARTRPDIVFVCLGSPKQEIFIKRMRIFSEKTLFIGLGGSADIYSGEKKRAPRLFRAVGCEWLYRMIREPKRMKRIPKLVGFLIENSKKSNILGQNRQKSMIKRRKI